VANSAAIVPSWSMATAGHYKETRSITFFFCTLSSQNWSRIVEDSVVPQFPVSFSVQTLVVDTHFGQAHKI